MSSPGNNTVSLLKEAFAYPFRKGGWVLIILLAVASHGVRYMLPEQLFSTWLSYLIFATLIILQYATQIILKLRSISLTMMGGRHLFALPSGPFGVIVLSYLILVGLAYIITLTLVKLPFVTESKMPITNLIAALLSFYLLLATCSVAADGRISGMMPRRVWRLIKTQPKHCALLIGFTIFAFLMTTPLHPPSGSPGYWLVLMAPLSYTFFAIQGRLTGLVALNYREGSSASASRISG